MRIEPTEASRIGDMLPSGRPAKFDTWSIESPSGREAPLGAQTESLFALLQPALRPSFEMAPVPPHLQYVVYAGREPVDFGIGPSILRDLTAMNAGIEFDCYWEAQRSFTDSMCDNCRVRLPLSPEASRPFVGGESKAAEFQMKLALYGVPESLVRRRFTFADEWGTVLESGLLSVDYLRELNCLQFSSAFTGLARSADFELYRPFASFIDAAEPFARDFAAKASDSEILLRIVERGDYQGSADLHLDAPLLERCARFGARLRLLFRYLPEPSFSADGRCRFCPATRSNPFAEYR